MNTLSKILLGFLVLAVFACLWFVLTQKNKGGGSGCCGSCSDCASACNQRREEQKKNEEK